MCHSLLFHRKLTFQRFTTPFQHLFIGSWHFDMCLLPSLYWKLTFQSFAHVLSLLNIKHPYPGWHPCICSKWSMPRWQSCDWGFNLYTCQFDVSASARFWESQVLVSVAYLKECTDHTGHQNWKLVHTMSFMVSDINPSVFIANKFEFMKLE